MGNALTGPDCDHLPAVLAQLFERRGGGTGAGAATVSFT